MQKNQFLVFFGLLVFILVLTQSQELETKIPMYHSTNEMLLINYLFGVANIDSSDFFIRSNQCQSCHGLDIEGLAMVDDAGQSVNVFDDWNSSMMANSAKDPFWRAKVSHEVHLYAANTTEIENVCTSCHAPMGHYNAILKGADHYSMVDLMLDSLGLDGVGCGACHQISISGLGDLNSGEIRFDTTRVINGPFAGPFAEPMEDSVGFTPLYAPHVSDAGLCASCHTLLTSTLDFEGLPSGDSFVEQATYHEWLNSDYSGSASCQSCHLPELVEEVIMSSGYPDDLEARGNYSLHDLVGGNVTMLKLMKENRTALGIQANEASYDETIDKTLALLQEKTAKIELSYLGQDMDSLYLGLELLNLVGHKFPSGYPSRRTTIELIVTTVESGDTLFISGQHDDSFEVVGHNEDYEPHYDVITGQDQVQIYELVMGDVNGDVTTVLVRAKSPLKDNRLAPLGFKTSHSVYDTTQIAGLATNDPNFNIKDGEEGSGTDFIKYHINISEQTELVNVEARLWYQSLPPNWMDEMFEVSTPQIDLFKEQFENADRTPILIDSAIIENIVLKSNSLPPNNSNDYWLTLVPNPTSSQSETAIISNLPEDSQLRVFDSNGKLIKTYTKMPIKLSAHDKGIFFIEVSHYKGKLFKKWFVL